MNARRSAWGCLLAAIFVPSLLAAAPADSATRGRGTTTRDGTDARLKTALQASLERHLDEAHLDQALAGYVLSPSLIQLRRYVGPAPGSVKLVCVVGLAVKSEHGIVADVRGNAATLGASATETIDAATRAAVSRLPSALALLRAKDDRVPVASR